MGCIHSRPSSHPSSPLIRISDLISSAAWRLSSLFNDFYTLLLYPFLRLQGPSDGSTFRKHVDPTSSSPRTRWASLWTTPEGRTARVPIHYRPGKRFRQQQDVERRRRRAAQVAEQASQALLSHSAPLAGLDDDHHHPHTSSHALTAANPCHPSQVCDGRRTPLMGERQELLTLDEDGEKPRATNAAKRRSAPPRYAPRAATSDLVTATAPPPPTTTTRGKGEGEGLMLPHLQQGQAHSGVTPPQLDHREHHNSRHHPVHHPPLANVKNRAVSTSSSNPKLILTRPSPAFLVDKDFKSISSDKNGNGNGNGKSGARRGSMEFKTAASRTTSPRSSVDIRRQAMMTYSSSSTSAIAYNANGQNGSGTASHAASSRPPSFDHAVATLSPSSTSYHHLPLSRTSTGLSAFSAGTTDASSSSSSSSSSPSCAATPIFPPSSSSAANSPRTSISDLASAACSRKNAARERKYWREEIDKIAKRKVVTAASGGGATMTTTTTTVGSGAGKRSSLGV